VVCSWQPTPRARATTHPDTGVALRAPHKVSLARSPTMSTRMVSPTPPGRKHAYRSEQDVATIATRRERMCFQTMRSASSATRSVSCSPSSLEFELIESAVLCADIPRWANRLSKIGPDHSIPSCPFPPRLLSPPVQGDALTIPIRLDLYHHMQLLSLRGELFVAKIPEKPQRILDCGTGTGIWALDVGEVYPSAEVLGVDLSPIQPEWYVAFSLLNGRGREGWKRKRNAVDGER